MSRVLIVGGVAGGASTAARFRRLDEHAEVVIFERGDYVSYANCGLPYYAGGAIKERDRLFVMTPGKFQDWLGVQVRTGHEAVGIDTARKVLKVKELASGRLMEESYDKLVLSPGAEPLRPPIPGIDLEGIFTLRSVPDVDRIKSWLDARRPERAVVVGGGFIGLEMAENLHARRIAVTVVEAQDQVMNGLDPEMAAMVQAQLRSKGVGLRLGTPVQAFERRGSRLFVKLAPDDELSADVVILSIGVRPDTGFIREAGIACAPHGAIQVDGSLRTSDPHVFALGDAVAVPSLVMDRSLVVPLAGPATKQARVVAGNLARSLRGEEALETYPGALGTSIAKVFDITAASAGANERALKAAALPFQAIITHGSSHAGYYPGALPLTLKALYEPATGRLLGAQVVGFDGVDKRMDLLAETLRRGGTVVDLARMEHAYAPPFSSSKDPINILGMVGENALAGLTRPIHWHEVEAWRSRGAVLLDVRSADEAALGSFPDTLNIPIDELRRRISEVPKDRPVLAFCGVGLRGYLAERILRQNGWTEVGNLSGGYKTWELVAGPLPGLELGLVFSEGSGEPEGLPRKDVTIQVDACGLACPGPILRLKGEMDKVPLGGRIIISASDPGFAQDVASWCRVMGHRLLSLTDSKGVHTATIEKQAAPQAGQVAQAGAGGATFIVFSDDLDRALATFVLANGAAASGKETTLFFTFWGLSVLKRREKPRVAKDFMGRMFGWMLPDGTSGLALSKMDFLGLGRLMMKARMKAKGVTDLDAMIGSARLAGVRFVACQMSMDLMGIAKEELVEGVEIGGVATYFEAAGKSQVNLFL
nr:FAD-dependent oxidoreductase [uncultured Holophaga sp.]